MHHFEDDVSVDAYLERVHPAELSTFLQKLRDHQHGFAAGAFRLADFSYVVDRKQVNLEAWLFDGIVFGYKWHQAAPRLLSNSSVTLSEYVDRVRPVALGRFFEDVLDKEVAFTAGDLAADDLTAFGDDIHDGGNGGKADGRIDVGQLLVKAVIFGTKLADERGEAPVLGETGDGVSGSDSDVGASGTD